jgi:hypothetical protein
MQREVSNLEATIRGYEEQIYTGSNKYKVTV